MRRGGRQNGGYRKPYSNQHRGTASGGNPTSIRGARSSTQGYQSRYGELMSQDNQMHTSTPYKFSNPIHKYNPNSEWSGGANNFPHGANRNAQYMPTGQY